MVRFPSTTSSDCLTSFLAADSGRQFQGRKFLSGGTEGAKLVHRCSDWGKRERLEWLREHLVQVSFGADANCNMRIEFFAGCDRHKVGHVVDQGLLDVATFLRGHERCGGPSIHREGRYCSNQSLLQIE